MDELQLKLCDIQGRLFELSGTQEIPSEAFIKAFMTSETAKALDSTYNRMQWMGEEYLLEEVKDAAGDILTASGEIFQTSPNAEAKKICNSLAEYICI